MAKGIGLLIGLPAAPKVSEKAESEPVPREPSKKEYKLAGQAILDAIAGKDPVVLATAVHDLCRLCETYEDESEEE